MKKLLYTETEKSNYGLHQYYLTQTEHKSGCMPVRKTIYMAALVFS